MMLETQTTLLQDLNQDSSNSALKPTQNDGRSSIKLFQDSEMQNMDINGYIIELKDEPVLERKTTLEKDLRKLRRELRELKGELKQIDESKGLALIKASKKALKNLQIGVKSIQSDNEEKKTTLRVKDYKRYILSKKDLEKNGLERIVRDRRKIKLEYIDAFNGFFADISKEEAEEIRKLDFVKEVHPNRQVNITLFDSVPLINADDVWALGHTGKNVTIGIIDTGVDYTHGDLGGCFGGVSGGGSQVGTIPNAESTIDSYCSTFQQMSNQEDVLVLTQNLNAISDGACQQSLSQSQLESILSKRKNLLLELIEFNPDRALLVEELNANVINSLSQEMVSELVEARLEFVGDLEVIHFDDFDNPENAIFRNFLHTKDQVYELFVEGNEPVYLSGFTVRVKGIELDNKIAVQPTESGFVEIIAGYDPRADNLGKQSTIVIVAGYGKKNPITTVDGARNLIFGTVYDYYLKNSFNKSFINGTVVGPYNLSDSVCSYDSQRTSALAAAAADVNLLNYWRVIMLIPATNCTPYGGLGTLGKNSVSTPDGTITASFSWDYYATLGIAGHEFGHNFGVHHANSYTCKDASGAIVPYSSNCTTTEYGDKWDIMGGSSRAHLNTAHKAEIGWLTNQNSVTASQGNYILKPLEVILQPGELQQIKLPISPNVYFTLEWRQPYDYDDSLSSYIYNGILIRVATYNNNSFSFKQTNILDFNSTLSYSQPLSIGKSFVDQINKYNITFNGISQDGASVTIKPLGSGGGGGSGNTSGNTSNTSNCKVIDGYDFVNKDTNPMDDHGHGTHVAATAAGNGTLKGVAPDAKIVAYKVLNSAGSGYWSDVIAAIERSVDPNQDGNYADHLDVISLSLGGSGDPDDPPSKAIDNAVANGVVVVVAAGNSGPSSGTINSPGTARKAITVGATDKTNVIASFSSIGPVTWSGGSIIKPDIVAPGVSICAAQWQNAWSSSQCIDTEHTSISGTSMATPHVSGLAALLLEKNPDWTPLEIKSALKNTAVNLGYDINTQGSGRIDALAVIQLTTPPPIAILTTSGYVRGVVNITGSATSTNLKYYVLEYGEGKSPISWTLITNSTKSIENGVLAIWNTTFTSYGEYALKLTVVDNKNFVSEERTLVTIVQIFQQGWPQYVASFQPGYRTDTDAAPAVADIDNDGKNEIIVATSTFGGEVYVWNFNGTLEKGWPVKLGAGISTSPSVADIDNDGDMEIFVGLADSSKAYHMYAYHHDGKAVLGWPVITKPAGYPYTYVGIDYSSPSIGDIDNNGDLEIVAGSLDYLGNESIFAWHHDGKRVNNWPKSAGNAIIGSPALADIDKDGNLEIIAGTSSSGFNSNKGQLYIWHHNGSSFNGWPIQLYIIPGVKGEIRSSPVIGDIDNDGVLEIVVGLFGFGSGNVIYAFEPSGKIESGFPIALNAGIFSSPALGDIDNDKDLEIVVGAYDKKVYVFHHNGAIATGWPITIAGEVVSSPILANVDGDNYQEIIIGEKGSCQNPDCSKVSGKLYVFNHDGTNLIGWPFEVEGGVDVPVSVADVDKDGDVEIISPSAWDFVNIFDLDAPYIPANNEWPIHNHDNRRTGYYGTKIFEPTSVNKYHYYTLNDSDCQVNLTLASINGNHTLFARYLPNACDELWDANISTLVGQTKSLIKTGLNKGSYAIKISGIGTYTLTKDSICFQDGTAPKITINSIPNLTNNNVLLSANVSDTNGLQGCEVCISNDNLCDTEWTKASVNNNFNYGAKQGSCSSYWNISNYNDGDYILNLRVIDVGNNTASGNQQPTFLDKTSPVIHYVIIPTIVKASSQIKFTANITDNYGTNNVSAVLDNTSLIAQKDNLTNLYEGNINAPSTVGIYIFTLTASDIIGNKAKKDVTIKVEEPINWSNDAVLTFDSYTSINPSIVVDSNKNMHIAWEDYKDGNSEIYYNKFDSKNKILVHNKRLTNNLYNSKNPNIKADSFNNMHIVWSDDRDGNKEIYYSKLDINGGILIDNKRLTANTFSSEMPKILADENNNFQVLWLDNRDQSFNIYYKKFDNNANILISDKKITFDNIIYFDVVLKTNITAIVYQNSLNEVFYSSLDNNGNIILNKKIQSFGLNPSLALGNFVDIVYVNPQNDIEYGKFDFDGNLILNMTKITSGYASNPSIISDASNNLHIAWEDNRLGKKDLYYTKLDQNGNILITQGKITINATNIKVPKIIVGSINIIYQDKVQSNDEIFLKTSSLDTTAPIISSVGTSDVREFSALITWQSDEPSTSLVNYGTTQLLGLTQKDTKLIQQHSLLMSNLNPSTQYFFEVESSDLFANNKFDNNNGFYYTFKTSSTQNRPALPTTFYGLVIYNNGTPASDVIVTATWVDTNNIAHNTSVKTLNINEALGLNDSSLVGYFLFNLGNVKAREGSIITVSAPGDITVPDPFVYAAPGGSSVKVTNPIVLDISPPKINITKPQEITYLTPFLSLNYTTDEEISWAGFKLNQQDVVTITGMRDKAINITAKIGENTLTVFARDLVGLESSKIINFIVQDTIAPKVIVNDAKKVNKVANLFANVSDSTNSLKQSCEVCISSDGICDTEWTTAINEFLIGDIFGRCTYSLDTLTISSGNYTLNFRVYDIANNLGIGMPKIIEVDNNPPSKVSGLLVASVIGKDLLNLTWDVSSVPDFKYYNVYKDLLPFVDTSLKTPIANVIANSYIDANLISRQTYYYAVTAIDSLGNEDKIVSSTSGTVADTIKPILTIISPTSTIYNQKTIDLIYNVNEPVNFCVYSLNKGNNISVSGTITVNEGTNILELYCEDMGRNIGQASVSFTVDTIAPSKITDLKVSIIPKENALLLEWSQIQNETILNYNIYRLATPFTNVANLSPSASSKVNSYKDTNLISEGIYYYAVTAIDHVSNEDKGVLSVKGIVADTITPTVKILSPTNIVYKTKSIDLNYTVDEQSGFCWYKLNNGNNVFITGNTKISALEGTNTVALFCNDTGSNIGSAQVSFDVDSEILAQISGLQVTGVSKENSLQLSWNPSNATDFLKYNIYRLQTSFNNVGTLTPIASTSSNSYKDINLVSEQTYHYAITAVDKYNNEDKNVVSSNGSVADTTAPNAVTGLKVNTVPKETSLSLTWDKNTANDFSKYSIYRSSAPFNDVSSMSPITNVVVENYKDMGLASSQTYHYAITAIDNVGNENKNVNSISGTVADIAPPIITITSPTNKKYNAKDISLEYNVNEPTSCVYSLNNNQNITLISTTTTINANEGSNIINIYCNDTSWNSGSASQTFTVDTTAPAQVKGLVVNTIKGQNSLNLSWNANKELDLSQYKIYRDNVSFNDVSQKIPIASTTLTSYTDTNLISQRTYYYAVTAVDDVSNENKSAISVSGAVADTTAPEPVTVNVSIVEHKPSLDISWNQNNDNDFSHYNIYRSSSPGVLIKSIYNRTLTSYEDINLSSSKTYHYTVTTVDKNGNENIYVNAISGTVADLDAPIVTLTLPTNKTYNTKSISLAYITNEPVSWCSYSLNNAANLTVTPTITANEGSNTIRVYCNDTSSNFGASNLILFSVDTIAPSQIKGLIVNTIPKQNSLNLTWQASSAVDFAYYKMYRSTSSFNDVSSMSPLTTTINNKFTDQFLVSELTYYYAITAIDIVENENKSVVSVSGKVADTIAPEPVTGLIVSPMPKENALNLTWGKSLAADLAYYNVYRSLNSFNDVSLMQPIINLSTEKFKDGGLISGQTYYYAIIAVDGGGNYNKNAVSVSSKVTDTIVPNVTLISPTNIKYNTKTISLQYNVNEPTAWCVYSLNNAPNITASSNIIASEGSNTIKLYCSDTSGNIGASTLISFFVDTTPPSQVTGLSIASIKKQASLNLTWNANTEADFSLYRIYKSLTDFNDVNSLTSITQLQDTSFVDTSLKSETRYYYAITSVDSMNNENKSVQTVSTITADLTPPIIIIDSPKPITYNAKALTFAYTTNEVTSCIYSLNNALNTSINGSKAITANEGSNALKIFCSDSNENRGIAEVIFNVDTEAPAQILGLSVSPLKGENSLQLSWNPSNATDFLHYNIYRGKTSFNDVSSITPIVTSTINSFKDIALISQETYYYSITAVDIYNNENKKVVSVNGTVADTIAPEQVIGLNVVRIGNQLGLNLSWNQNQDNDFSHYNLYRSESNFSDISLMIPIKANVIETIYTDLNVNDGKTYFYAVTSVDSMNNENKNVIAKSAVTLDFTSPEVFISSVGNRVAGVVVLSATVTDKGVGLERSCEVCLTKDGNCDTEWTSLNVLNDFNSGNKNGTCSYSWNTANYPVGIYISNFRVLDLDNNIGIGLQQQTELINATGKFQFSIPLYVGWNLISIPLLPEDQSIEVALSSIKGSYTKVYYYNSNTGAWEIFNSNRGLFDQPNNLLQLTAGKGYWIEITQSNTLTMSGFEVVDYSSSLNSGWNYIGYPYYGSKNISLALASLGNNYNKIYSYNAELGKWDVYNLYQNTLEPNSITEMNARKGYLIDMSLPNTWKP